MSTIITNGGSDHSGDDIIDDKNLLSEDRRPKALSIEHKKRNNKKKKLKKSKLFSLTAPINDLHTRSDTITNQILNKVKTNSRKSFTTEFRTLKHENDRIRDNFVTLTTSTELSYQSSYDELNKLEDETDKKCMDAIKKIHEVANYVRMLPINIEKRLAKHTRTLDRLEMVSFDSDFAKEGALQETILATLKTEQGLFDNILKVENTYPNIRAQNVKPIKLENVNCESSKNVLVVRNMEEGFNELDDIIKFQQFLHQATGRVIFITGVERYGTVGTEPRLANITLKTPKDLDDVLNSKSVADKYGHVQVSREVESKKY